MKLQLLLFFCFLTGCLFAFLLRSDRLFHTSWVLFVGVTLAVAVMETVTRPVDTAVFLFALGWIVLPFGLMLLYMEWINKHDKRLQSIIRRIVSVRIAEKATIPARQVVRQCRINKEDVSKALLLLDGMARILSDGKNKLHPSDVFADLLRVKTVDLPLEYAKALRRSNYKTSEYIWCDSYTDQLTDFFVSRINYDHWKKPLYDDDLEDFLLTASVCELLRTFASLFVAEQS